MGLVEGEIHWPSGEWKKDAGDNGKSSADVAVVDEAISDDAWWHYLQIICVFAHVEHNVVLGRNLPSWPRIAHTCWHITMHACQC